MLRFTMASTFASNPSWFKWAVFLGQKWATLGKDVAPNRCSAIRYPTVSSVRSSFGHHKIILRFKKCHNLLGPPGIGETLPLLSATTPTVICLYRFKTPASWSVRSRPCINCWSSDICPNFAVHCRPMLPQLLGSFRKCEQPCVTMLHIQEVDWTSEINSFSFIKYSFSERRSHGLTF